ncbi:hypothetical protein ABZW10_38645 [Kitasatospora sp. NPDC004723]|uniref:hypothetical protein n=1 Tax=Kitasatospora sp. NPDC004723 TaxID=3154288 RepID=UPI0033BBBCC4
MDEDEAQQLANSLRRLGIRGIVSPEDLGNPDGQWRVYDSANPNTRRDITDDVLTVVRGRSRQAGQSGPTRGFVIHAPR